jgi:hypothetical protein
MQLIDGHIRFVFLEGFVVSHSPPHRCTPIVSQGPSLS